MQNSTIAAAIDKSTITQAFTFSPGQYPDGKQIFSYAQPHTYNKNTQSDLCSTILRGTLDTQRPVRIRAASVTRAQAPTHAHRGSDWRTLRAAAAAAVVVRLLLCCCCCCCEEERDPRGGELCVL